MTIESVQVEENINQLVLAFSITNTKEENRPNWQF
jgi:hypothetical protein